MKYVITKSNISDKEMVERMKYIYEVFRVYVFKDNKSSTKDFIVLKSIPINEINLCIIVGHDLITYEYINKFYGGISEEYMLIISCNTCRFKNCNFLKRKKLYTPKNKGVVITYNGNDYGFEFEITEEEILLYRNRNKKIQEVLDDIFERR